MNVFHCSRHPAACFDNILEHADIFDCRMVNRYRSEKDFPFQMDIDLDSMRALLSFVGCKINFQERVRFVYLQREVADFHVYVAEGKHGIMNLHFTCNMKGKLMQ